MAGKEGNIKVSIRNVVKKYDTRNGEMIALNGANLDIMENEFICVIGPSGCGKSTFLRTIAVNAVLSQTIFTSVSKNYQAPYFRI